MYKTSENTKKQEGINLLLENTNERKIFYRMLQQYIETKNGLKRKTAFNDQWFTLLKLKDSQIILLVNFIKMLCGECLINELSKDQIDGIEVCIDRFILVHPIDRTWIDHFQLATSCLTIDSVNVNYKEV